MPARRRRTVSRSPTQRFRMWDKKVKGETYAETLENVKPLAIPRVQMYQAVHEYLIGLVKDVVSKYGEHTLTHEYMWYAQKLWSATLKYRDRGLQYKADQTYLEYRGRNLNDDCLREIAVRLGVTISPIQEILSRVGIAVPPPPPVEVKVETLDELIGHFSEEFSTLLENWLTGWSYRKPATIKGSTSGSVTDYQIRVTVHYGAGADGGEHVYLNGKCRADFGDIRFTDIDKKTLLPYWVEEKVDGDYAVIWVKIPYIPTYPDTRLFYIYYGKSDATSISDGNATFIFFDDFTVKDTSKWQFLGTYPPVIENGQLKTSSTSNTTSYVWSIPTFPCDKGYKMSVKGRSPSGGVWRGCCRLRDNGEISIWYPADAGAELQYGCGYAGSGTSVRVASNIALTHKHVAHFHPGAIVRWFYDGTKVLETTNPSYIFPLNPDIILKVEIGDSFSDSGYGTVYWDDFFIAKHIHPEPSIVAWGSEESL